MAAAPTAAALFEAAESGSDELHGLIAAAEKAGTLQRLLLRRQHGLTALHRAAEMGHFRAVTELLARGGATAANAITAAGVTPLHMASERGRNDVVDVLVAFGAEQPPDDFGSTPLHRASFAGSVEVVSMLLEGGAIEDARDTNGHTPLHVAAHCGYRQVVCELLRGGASPRVLDQYSQTPRFLAEAAGHRAVAQCLDDFLSPADEPLLLETVMPALQ